MLSRADRRLALERVLRAMAYLALAGALVSALRAASPEPRRTIVRATALASRLPAFTRGEPDSLAIVTDTALDAAHRDWLAALRRAGTPVAWGGAPIPATAVVVEPSGDPGGGARVLAAAPGGTMAHLADDVGPIDSARASGGGVTFAVPALAGEARLASGAQFARAHAVDSLGVRRVVVLGEAGWEGKFVAAALEERGWTVELRLSVAPGLDVVQGTPINLDTAGVAAVVALDANAARAADAIVAFVRRGGGVVLAPAAAKAAAFAPLLAGHAGTRLPPPVLAFTASEPRRALPLSPIGPLRPDAVVIERRRDVVAVAARRVGAGRVVQLGYDETWRWRMTGPDDASDAHRRWWTSLVAAAAYRATIPTGPAVQSADAPLASMVASLGPPDPTLRAASLANGTDTGAPAWWLFAFALSALFIEWASRRLRGAA